VNLRDLADVPLVVFPRHLAPGFHDTIMDCYGAAGLAPRVGQEAIQMQTITGLVWRAEEVSPVLAAFIEIVRAHAATVNAKRDA
jgi:hypothetical protein